MNCSNCGTLSVGGAQFCSHCGASLSAPSQRMEESPGPRVGDVGMVRGDISSKVETHDIHFHGVLPDFQHSTTKEAFCALCGTLLRDNYFRCLGCSTLCCAECRDRGTRKCLSCARLSEHASVKPSQLTDNEVSRILTNSIGMKMVRIPRGEFLMGSPQGAKSAHGHETPQHRVTISHSFDLGAFPVTQEEFQRVMGTNPSKCHGDGRRPVEQVSWMAAVEFCNRLSQMEGLSCFYQVSPTGICTFETDGYRLPTEAEWEYACRAGTQTGWSWGDDESQIDRFAWYRGNNRGSPQAVGLKEPNPWGFFDMHGNVWEWCWDWFDETYYTESPVTDPTGPMKGMSHVVRGGSFLHPAKNVRSALRNFYDRKHPNTVIGFRVARTAKP